MLNPKRFKFQSKKLPLNLVIDHWLSLPILSPPPPHFFVCFTFLFLHDKHSMIDILYSHTHPEKQSTKKTVITDESASFEAGFRCGWNHFLLEKKIKYQHHRPAWIPCQDQLYQKSSARNSTEGTLCCLFNFPQKVDLLANAHAQSSPGFLHPLPGSQKDEIN